MRPTTVEALLRRHRLAWESACEITGVGASRNATHRLYVTDAGDLLFHHGPAAGAPEWTHFAPGPHAAGTVLARWEPGTYEFIFHFDRDWDPMVATCAVREPLDPRLWAALRPHLLPIGRQQPTLWESRFYCLGLLRPEPLETGGEQEATGREAPLLRFVRVSADEHHLLLSLCSSSERERISLYGALAVAVPYGDLIGLGSEAHRRRWAFQRPVVVGGQAIHQVEIEIPEVEAGNWAALDELIREQRGTDRADPDVSQSAGAVYAIGGIAGGLPLAEDWVRVRLDKEALLLQDPATGVAIQTVPYRLIQACAIQRHDPADDFLVVAPGIAAVIRQAGVEVRQLVENQSDLAALKEKLNARTATVVERVTGIPGRPEMLPTGLRLEGAAFHADWGIATATLSLDQITTCRWVREAPGHDGEPERVRLIIGRPGQEWEAVGSAERLLPLVQAVDESVLPHELERESLADLYARWQRRRAEPLVWGILSDVAWLDMGLRRLAEAPRTAAANSEAVASAACDLLACSLDNVKARLGMLDLYLPYWVAAEEESFLRQLGDVAEPVRERSCRYVERAVRAIIGTPLAHLHRAVEEIEKNLATRDELRQVPRPGKLTLGFDASYGATLATTIGAAVLGPLGAVAGVALSSLQLNQETRTKNELQAHLVQDYETNTLTWWQHLIDRIVPLLVRQLVMESDRLSRSLAPRDRQICDRLTTGEPESDRAHFRSALTVMLLSHARFRWSRIETQMGESVTAGEMLDRLLAMPPPTPTFHALFPMAARPLPDPLGGPMPPAAVGAAP